MDLNTFGIVSAFIVNAALVLWLIIGCRGNWLLKMAVTGLTLYFSLAIWVSLGDLLGWASQEPPPEKFLVHWILVKEPSQRNDHEEAIYVWLSELNENHGFTKHDTSALFPSFTPKRLPGEPRVHRLPYSKEMHEQSQQIMQLLMNGVKVVGGTNGMGTGGLDGEAGEGGIEGDGEGSMSPSYGPELYFYQLPPAQLPQKVAE